MAIYKDYGSPPPDNTDALPHVAGLNAADRRGNGGIVGDGLKSQYDFGRFSSLGAIGARYQETPVEYEVAAGKALSLGSVTTAYSRAVELGDLSLTVQISGVFGGETPETLTVVYDGTTIQAAEDQTLDVGGAHADGNEYLVITPATDGTEVNEYVVSLDADQNLIITPGNSAPSVVITVENIGTAGLLAGFDVTSVAGFAHPGNAKTVIKAALEAYVGASLGSYETAAANAGFDFFNPPPYTGDIDGSILGWYLTCFGAALPARSFNVAWSLVDQDTCNGHNLGSDSGVFKIYVDGFNLSGVWAETGFAYLLANYGNEWRQPAYATIVRLAYAANQGATVNGQVWRTSAPVLNWNTSNLVADMTGFISCVEGQNQFPIFPDSPFTFRDYDLNNTWKHLHFVDSSATGGASCVTITNNPGGSTFNQDDPWALHYSASPTGVLASPIVWSSDIKRWSSAVDFNGASLWTSC